ncbi:hypothetical protein LTR28_013023, partial [Elasticomyces elasticus]
MISEALSKLSAKAIQRGTKIRVRIGFSSLSIWQKLFQTSNLNGRIYPSTLYTSTLGIPHLDGLDVEVKSIFVRPFSVMHPKFIVVDRRRVFLPSCNVSWEEWFEGCVELSGAIVDQFVHFWEDFWKSSHDATIELPNPLDLSGASEEPLLEVTPIFLPSSHHRNPRFRPFPWQPVSAPPRTPLNVFILKAIAAAEQSVYIQTPNLTAIPVLSSVLNALRCGIDVSILTSERLMILEQLVTAGTTTSRCVRKLIKRYK